MIGLTRNTANKIQKLLADAGDKRGPDRPTQTTSHYMLVRCLSQDKATAEAVEEECYSGVIINPESPVASESFDELGLVWLTGLGTNGPEMPIRDQMYLCRILGYLDIGGDERPRAVAVAGDHAGPVWVCGRPAEGEGWQTDIEGLVSIDGLDGLTNDTVITKATAISTTNPTFSSFATIARIKLPAHTKGTRWAIYGHARVLVELPTGSSDTFGSGSSSYGFYAQLYCRSAGGSNAKYRTLWIEKPFRMTINAGDASEEVKTFGNMAAAGGTMLLVKDWPTTESDVTIVDLQVAWNFSAYVPGASGEFRISVSEWELYAVRHPSTQLCCYHPSDEPPTIVVDTVETDPEATIEQSLTVTLVYTLLIEDAEDGYPTDVSVDAVGDPDVITGTEITSIGSGLWELSVKGGDIGQSSIRILARDSRGQVTYWTATITVIDDSTPGPEITTP